LDLSLAKRSPAPWLKDKLHSDETKKITISETSHANKLSAENRGHNIKSQDSHLLSPRPPTRRIPWNKGTPLSDETKKKMSQAHMGKPPTFKGRKHSAESRQKQSLAHKGKSPSEQTRLKISGSVKRYFARRRAEKKL
jgi:hypothetical protein